MYHGFDRSSIAAGINEESILSYHHSLTSLNDAITNNDINLFKDVAFKNSYTMKGNIITQSIKIHGNILIERIIRKNRFKCFKILIQDGHPWEQYTCYPTSMNHVRINMKTFVLWYTYFKKKKDEAIFTKVYKLDKIKCSILLFFHHFVYSTDQLFLHKHVISKIQTVLPN